MVDFSQQLQPSNFQAYVQKGVVDQSKGMKAAADISFAKGMIGTGMEVAQEIDKGMVLQGLTEEVNAIAEEQQRRSLAGVQGLEQETMMLSQSSELAKKEAGYTGAYPTMLNAELSKKLVGINNELTTKTEQLARAKEQGIMKESELKSRLNVLALQAVQNNPAYAREIMSHVATLAELNNITINVKQDEAALAEINKSQQAQAKDIMDELEKLHIPEASFTDGRGNLLDPEGAMLAIDAKRSELARAEQINRQAEMNQKIATLNSQQFFGTGLHIEYSVGALAYADSKFQAILNDPNITEVKKQEQLLKEGQRLTLNLTKSFPLMGLSQSDTQVKDLVNLLTGQIKDLQDIYTKEATGELDLAQKKRKLELQQTASQIGLYDRIPNLAEYNFFMKFAESLGTRAGMSLTQELNNSIAKNLTENPLSIGTPYEKGGAVYDTKAPDGKYIGTHGLATAIDTAVSLDATPDDISLLEKQLTNFNAKLNSNPANATELIRDLNGTLSTPNFKAVVDKIQDTTILGSLQENILASTTLLETAVANTLPENAKISLRPDGRLQVTGGDMRTQSQLVRSINEAFLAFANVSGLTGDALINEFYGRIPSLGLGSTPEKK